MKKTLLILTLVLTGFCSVAQEQNSERFKAATPELIANRYTDIAEKELSLSAEQKKQFYAITLERATRMEANRATNGRQANLFAVEKQKISAEWEKAIEPVLTAEQFKKLKKCQQDMDAKKSSK